MKLIRTALAAALLAGTGFAAPALAQQAQAPRNYELGPVVEIRTMKVEPGQLNNYMALLNGVWRKQQEERKKAGEVLDYGVYQPMAGSEAEGNLQLVVVYKNAAAMDTSLDILDKRLTALAGGPEAQARGVVERNKLRTFVGTSLLRELRFTQPPQ